MLRLKRLGHSLVVPYTHSPFTNFEKGIPVKQVRDSVEKWDFWSTSTAFYPTTPKATGLVTVPKGERWIIERNSNFNRVLESGDHFLIPFVDKIKTVKLSSVIATGVHAPSKDGDAYAVAYFTVVDPSAYFLDAETNKLDSERSAAREIRFGLAQAQGKPNVAQLVLEHLKSVQSKLGLQFTNVEYRGIFAQADNIPDKIRAMDKPNPDFDAPGHDLANDYWGERLTPAFFEKMTFGSQKVRKTPAAVSLEWSVPSPPDFHHFNMIPKLVVPPEPSSETEPSSQKAPAAAHH